MQAHVVAVWCLVFAVKDLTIVYAVYSIQEHHHGLLCRNIPGGEGTASGSSSEGTGTADIDFDADTDTDEGAACVYVWRLLL